MAEIHLGWTEYQDAAPMSIDTRNMKVAMNTHNPAVPFNPVPCKGPGVDVSAGDGLAAQIAPGNPDVASGGYGK